MAMLMNRKEIEKIRSRGNFDQYVSDMDIAEDVIVAYERSGSNRFPFCNCEIVAEEKNGYTVFKVAS
jgi:hypothetical protein